MLSGVLSDTESFPSKSSVSTWCPPDSIFVSRLIARFIMTVSPIHSIRHFSRVRFWPVSPEYQGDIRVALLQPCLAVTRRSFEIIMIPAQTTR